MGLATFRRKIAEKRKKLGKPVPEKFQVEEKAELEAEPVARGKKSPKKQSQD